VLVVVAVVAVVAVVLLIVSILVEEEERGREPTMVREGYECVGRTSRLLNLHHAVNPAN
jgi:hypothetical protein